jgi:hypothetical protein
MSVPFDTDRAGVIACPGRVEPAVRKLEQGEIAIVFGGHHLPGLTIDDEPASDDQTPPATGISDCDYREGSSC